MKPFSVREYREDDLEACLHAFDTNVPQFFREEERAEYVNFLAHLPGPYFVLLDASGAVSGCGGYAISEDSHVADLCWGMVRQEWHGRGGGRVLTELRIERAREDARVRAIQLGTSQLTSSFYERLGFRTTGVAADGYGPGLDRVDMRLELGQ